MVRVVLWLLTGLVVVLLTAVLIGFVWPTRLAGAAIPGIYFCFSAARSLRRNMSIGDSLDWFVGSWSEEQAREFDEAVADFERIDEKL